MDSIRGPNFGVYDARHLEVSQRDRAKSVKPNVFREVETEDTVEKFLQQLTQDAVSLSPEAKELMQLLKRYGKNSKELKDFVKKNNLKELVYSFKDLRDLVYGEDEEEEEDGSGKKRKKKKYKPAVPNQIYIKLSNNPNNGQRSSNGGDWDEEPGLAGRMVVFCEDNTIKRMLVRELTPFGDKIISAVKKFGVKIIVLPKNQTLTQIKIKGMSVVAPGERTFDGRPWDIVRGLYDNSRRLIVIGEEMIGHPRHSTARHEFAHAFDHAYSEKHHRRLPLSVQLWNQFRNDRSGLVSTYAGVNPQEYFAESVEAYFRKYAKDELKKRDPQMYEYLETLFTE